MRRALYLAAHGQGTTGSNPMVGAVIVSSRGDILGEGWHRRYGEGHAEVNAVASVKDPASLLTSTMYVTLEPCSHYGKTPPCAQLIINSGIPRVVVATVDPFAKVSGRGIDMLRKAGVEVEVGMLGEESRRLNCRFFTAHTLGRPYILLKWARSADGFMNMPDGQPVRISTPLSTMEMHRLRSMYQAIMIGSGTALADNPHLDTRLWPMGAPPVKVIADRRGRVPADTNVLTSGAPAILITQSPRPGLPDSVTQISVSGKDSWLSIMKALYASGIISVMVEGGPTLLRSLLEEGLWDAARIETNPRLIIGGTPASASPVISPDKRADIKFTDGNIIEFFTNNPLTDVKNL